MLEGTHTKTIAEGPVSRCVCMELEFSDLHARAASEGLDFAQLRARTGCCTGCGTCEPYVRLMLATGQTRFAVLSKGEAERARQWCEGLGSASSAHPQPGPLG